MQLNPTALVGYRCYYSSSSSSPASDSRNNNDITYSYSAWDLTNSQLHILQLYSYIYKKDMHKTKLQLHNTQNLACQLPQHRFPRINTGLLRVNNTHHAPRVFTSYVRLYSYIQLYTCTRAGMRARAGTCLYSYLLTCLSCSPRTTQLIRLTLNCWTCPKPCNT